MRFKDKVVMISGAATGFGRVAAQRFAEEGARLSLCDIKPDTLAETAAMIDGDVITSTVNVSSEEDQQRWVAETVAKYGRIDIALNNAGVIHELKSMLETPLSEYDRMMTVNARGTFIGMRCEIPVMIKQGGGVILNTASVAGLIGDGVTVLGIVIIAIALLGYDRGRFLGTNQIRSPEDDADEELKTAGLLRYVRHPLYSGVFLVLWGHAQTEFSLATAVWGSIYLLIGAMYEERRLADRYEESYAAYRERVPAFIPWRGRARPD